MLFLNVFAVLAAVSASPIDPAKNCTLKWYNQKLDHFSYSPDTDWRTFKQRVYVCGEENWKKGEPIFFYCGNEADVTLYVRHTGLMWENKDRFGALLIFAEHRYYGESLPFGNSSFVKGNISYLSHEQALADYANVLLTYKQDKQSPESKVIAFGGSYGGMLSAWMRMKYPTTIDGAISASAPIFGFALGGKDSFTDISTSFGKTYWEVVTRDATPEAGARAGCDSTVRAAFAQVFEQAKTAQGRAQLQSTFNLCVLPTEDSVVALAYLLMYAWDMMAMGNYPYPTDYITGGTAVLSAYPVREACAAMIGTDGVQPPVAELLPRLKAATDIFNNATKDIPCYQLDDKDLEHDGIWDFQFCTQMLCQETYYARDGVSDMFWKYPFDLEFINQRCEIEYGVEPRPDWIVTQYGPLSKLDQYSNIVFSNGDYDPWSAAGVTSNVSSSVLAVVIEGGAHHLDLFFSNPEDPPSVLAARALEIANIEKWLRD